MRFLEEIRDVTKGNDVYHLADVEVLSGSQDKVEWRPGKYTAWISHSVLRRKLDRLAPLKGKVFDIENKGKPQGKRYFDYEVAEVQGS